MKKLKASHLPTAGLSIPDSLLEVILATVWEYHSKNVLHKCKQVNVHLCLI